MIRFTFCLAIITVLQAGCAGPIQTRVQTASTQNQTEFASYTFAEVPKQRSGIYEQAKKILADALKLKGLEQRDSAPLIVDFAAASRPASIAIALGEGQKSKSVAEPKTRKLLQSCDDSEHRLIVTVFQRNSGKQVYRGTAAEYHCKAALKQSLPHLVKAALSDWDQPGDGLVRERTSHRVGLE